MPMRLITIPVSHYCERARWALDHCGVDYVEEQHLQLLHLRAVKKAGGRRTTPVLTGGDELLLDSRLIVEFADTRASDERRLYPSDPAERAQVEEIERGIEGEYGVETRRMAYYYFLQESKLFHKYNGARAPRWERFMMRAGFPLVRSRARAYLKVNDETFARAKTIVAGHLDRVAGLLDGRRYLVGDRFTAADLTFAALTAPIVAPAEYGTPLPTLDELPPHFREDYEGYRSHPAGQFALRIFREHRR